MCAKMHDNKKIRFFENIGKIPFFRELCKKKTRNVHFTRTMKYFSRKFFTGGVRGRKKPKTCPGLILTFQIIGTTIYEILTDIHNKIITE